MSTDHAAVSHLRKEMETALYSHWKSFLVEGIILVLLGAAAIIVPQIATLTVALVIGWLLLFSGVVGPVSTFALRPAPGFWWSLISAIIAIVAGLVLLIMPAHGAITLTFVLIAFFLVEGVSSIMFAFEHKPQLPRSWGAMLFSGLVDIALAVIIFLGLPSSAAWAIGLLVGINLVFGGAALIAMALQARSQHSNSPATSS
jgi:uncharacterized membrane protein HdeD (DUF308 family)